MLTGGTAMTRVLGKPNPVRHDRLGFKQLTDVAARPSQRDLWEGDTGVVQGQFLPQSDNEFTLFRVDRTCCYADQTYLQVRVVAPEKVKIDPETWVRVRGTISFRKNEKGNWIPAIVLDSVDDIEVGVDPVTKVDAP
jgi:hypothetical protein